MFSPADALKVSADAMQRTCSDGAAGLVASAVTTATTAHLARARRGPRAATT